MRDRLVHGEEGKLGNNIKKILKYIACGGVRGALVWITHVQRVKILLKSQVVIRTNVTMVDLIHVSRVASAVDFMGPSMIQAIKVNLPKNP